jgi:hypothetical protein
MFICLLSSSAEARTKIGSSNTNNSNNNNNNGNGSVTNGNHLSPKLQPINQSSVSRHHSSPAIQKTAA